MHNLRKYYLCSNKNKTAYKTLLYFQSMITYLNDLPTILNLIFHIIYGFHLFTFKEVYFAISENEITNKKE